MPKADYRAAGHRLRVTRLTLGITELEAAAAHGVTLRTYRKWEAGHPQRGMKYSLAFAEKYNVSLDWLWAGEGLGLRHHLSAKTSGKLAILPTMSAWRRALLAKPPQWPA